MNEATKFEPNDPVMILSPNGLLKPIAYTTFRWPSRVKSSSPVCAHGASPGMREKGNTSDITGEDEKSDQE